MFYLFGAYNEINVIQMRAEVSVTEITEKKACIKIIDLMKKRLSGENIGDRFLNEPDEEEKEKALNLLLEGRIFLFEPISYFYDSYQRG